MTHKIGIVGGGVSGLSLAYFLERGDVEADISLLEAADSLGGKVQTDLGPNGEVIERGADSLLLRAGSPLEALLEETGLSSQIISPLQKTFSIQRAGVLHRVPLGMLQGMPKNLMALWRCSLFSLYGKCMATVRGLYDLIFSPSLNGDPSIATTLRSRYGKEVSKYFFETVFGGIHSGNADELSFCALYPDMANRSKSKGGKYHRARFISFKDGMGMLPQALRQNLKRTYIQTNAQIQRVLQTTEGRYRVEFSRGDSAEFDQLVLATPSWVSANLLEELSPVLAEKLSAIQHASSAVVTMVLSEKHVKQSPTGSGYLLSSDEGGYVTGCTYSSEKWDFRRGNDKETLLVRIFFGRNGGVSTVSDEDLLTAAHEEITHKLGYEVAPQYETIARWDRGLPQYACGHAERLEQITAALEPFPRLSIVGTSYRGVGIPDCVKESYRVAHSILNNLRGMDRSCQSSSDRADKDFLRKVEEKKDEEERYGKTVCA